MEGYALWAIVLLILGLGVLASEIFIPSGGILAAITLSCLVSSVYCAYMAWGTTSPWAFRVFVGAVVVLVPTVLVTGFSILPHTAIGKRLIPEPVRAEELALPSDDSALEALVGQAGVAASSLNPSGVVMVGGLRRPAVSLDLFIDAGTAVAVTGVRRGALQVKPMAAVSGAEAGVSEVPRAPLDSPLDFDFPLNS